MRGILRESWYLEDNIKVLISKRKHKAFTTSLLIIKKVLLQIQLIFKYVVACAIKTIYINKKLYIEPLLDILH